MKPDLRKTILGGVVATAIMTGMMYFGAPMLAGKPMDVAAMLASKMGGSWALGMAVHLFLGVFVLSLGYAIVFYRLAPGAPWLKGVFFGVGLWLIEQVTMAPFLGAGFFNANAGGGKVVMAQLIGHIVYGGLLGAIAGTPAQKARAVGG
jgi:hypothetical protein